MFKNILIPISSEFYPKHALNFSVFLATKFKCKIDLIYIIEEKTLDQTDKLSNGFRTFYDKNDTKKDIIGKKRQTADNIIFDYAKFIYDNQKISFSKKMVRGEFSTVINNETKKKEYDLVLMGFQKGSTLNYRLFENFNVPVWVKMAGDKGSILAVCSNLAPNKKVPDFSIKLTNSKSSKPKSIRKFIMSSSSSGIAARSSDSMSSAENFGAGIASGGGGAVASSILCLRSRSSSESGNCAIKASSFVRASS